MSSAPSTLKPLRLVQENPRDAQAWDELYRYTARTGDRAVLPFVRPILEGIIEAEADCDWLEGDGILPFKYKKSATHGIHDEWFLINAVDAAAHWLLGFDCIPYVCEVCSRICPHHELTDNMVTPDLFRYSMTAAGRRDIQLTKWLRLREQILGRGGLVLPLHDGQMCVVGGTKSGMIGGASVAAYGLTHPQGSNNWTDFEHVIPSASRFDAFVNMFRAARIARGGLWNKCYRDVFRPVPTAFQATMLGLTGQKKPVCDELPIEFAQRIVWGYGIDTKLVEPRARVAVGFGKSRVDTKAVGLDDAMRAWGIATGVYVGVLDASVPKPTHDVLDSLRADLAPARVSIGSDITHKYWTLRIDVNPEENGAGEGVETDDSVGIQTGDLTAP